MIKDNDKPIATSYQVDTEAAENDDDDKRLSDDDCDDIDLAVFNRISPYSTDTVTGIYHIYI